MSVALAGEAASAMCAHSPVAALREGCGLRFLETHYAEDVAHTASLAEAVRAAQLNSETLGWIVTCARLTGTLYPAFFQG